MKNKVYFLSFIIWLCVFSFLTHVVAFCQNEYISEALFSIPWGENEGEISLDWIEPIPPGSEDMSLPPSPIDISEVGGIVIADFDGQDNRLTRYDIHGTFISQINLDQINVPLPTNICITDAGFVLCVRLDKWYIFDNTLQLVDTSVITDNNKFIFIKSLWRSDDGNFWCLYDSGQGYLKTYLVKIYTNGTVSLPQQVFEGGWKDESYNDNYYASPTGITNGRIFDNHGYFYQTWWDQIIGLKLYKLTLQNDIIYTNIINDDPEYPGILDYFIQWSGNYITVYSSDSGIVLTKYTLNLDPVCDLIVVTPMPYQGPSPAAIEFDASNTYDPNPDDVLTFEWDFDGDGIFNEPVDDAYTGDQNHPTHEYTQNYEGFVTMRVTDNHEGECDSSVYISVVIQ